MPVPLTTDPGGLFTRLGRLAKTAALARKYRKGDAIDVRTIVEQQFTTDQEMVSDLLRNLDNGDETKTIGDIVAQSARDVLLRMVNDYMPQANPTSVPSALGALIRQMRLGGDSVQKCTTTIQASKRAPAVGDGVCRVSVLRGDGLMQENTFAERGGIFCSRDSYTGGSTAGQETFTFIGAAAESSPFSRNWPKGSGGNRTFSACDASRDNSGGNKLVNSDFEDWTSSRPDEWTVVAGNTTLIAEATSAGTYFDGSSSIAFTGDGATLHQLYQLMDTTGTGTAATLSPNTVYVVNWWQRVDAVPAAGAYAVELVDANGGVLSDAQGTACRVTVTVSSPTSGGVVTWTDQGGFFRTPKVLPSVYRLQIRFSTALTASRVVYLDRLSLTVAAQLYNGGPMAAVFSGVTNFTSGIEPDAFDVVTTNDRGGATDLQTFQTFFDQCFGMRDLELLLPSLASPTIADATYISFTGWDFDYSAAARSGLLAIIP